VLLQTLAILQNYSLVQMEPARREHVLIEAMRLAYRDRARYLGDPDFVSVDIERLLSPTYIRNLRREISHRAAPSEARPERPQAATGTNTTHFSIIDREGNRVAATLSINSPFGSGFVPPDTGVLLNNEMDDFAAKPDTPNLYGLVGYDANAIAPGKRPLSSMTPTFLEDNDRVAVLGTPGGSRIISMVLLATLDFSVGRGTAADWVKRPRFHHQYLPDVVQYEPGAFTDAEVRRLQQWGHTLRRLDNGYGNMQIVVWHKKTNRLEAASDPRGEGSAQVK
jgi:gamma-glutamyltranspeptidase / glutathione hydrolase